MFTAWNGVLGEGGWYQEKNQQSIARYAWKGVKTKKWSVRIKGEENWGENLFNADRTVGLRIDKLFVGMSVFVALLVVTLPKKLYLDMVKI